MVAGKGAKSCGTDGRKTKVALESHALPWFEGPISYFLLVMTVVFLLIAVACGGLATMGMNNMIFPGESLHVSTPPSSSKSMPS